MPRETNALAASPRENFEATINVFPANYSQQVTVGFRRLVAPSIRGGVDETDLIPLLHLGPDLLQVPL